MYGVKLESFIEEKSENSLGKAGAIEIAESVDALEASAAILEDDTIAKVQ